MPRLFISHSSVDNVHALAFQRWLVANGWSQEDVFIDLHGIVAGERWRETLRKANASCEAVILLASPASLDSKECQRELNLAEDLGKPILVVILRDVAKDDARLARWADTQFVDLSAEPQERMEPPLEHDGKLHRVTFHLPALLSIKASLGQRGIAPDSFAWKPRGKDSAPYPGLAAFGEEDAGIFLGREAEIMAGLTKLRLMRKRRSPRLLVIQAASGAGKSSYLRAGLWPRLQRDPDFAPLAILRPALGVLTGPDGFGRRFSPWLEAHGRKMAPADIHARLAHSDPQALAQLVADAAALATGIRHAGQPDARPPAPIIAIDQGEELFAAENVAESTRFLELLAPLLRSPPQDVDPYVLITIRADSVEALLQRWPALGLEAPEVIYLPPLSPDAYRDIIVKPAEVYSAKVKRLAIEPELTAALARNTGGADALPLLAFTLERLFGEAGADGNITLARYQAMGGMEGSIDRALAEARRKAGAAGSEAALHKLVVPGLATWDPAANAAKRLVAKEAELSGGERSGLAPLANALVDARLLMRGRDTIEVAHEALLRRPPIDGWLDQQKDALKLRDDVLKEAAEWAAGGKSQRDLVRRGDRLRAAEALAADLDFKGALTPAKAYLAGCRREERAAQVSARRRQAAIYTLGLVVIAALTSVIFKEFLISQYDWYVRTELLYARIQVWPFVRTAEQERALKPGESFRDCAGDADVCQDMVVLPIGEYWMGSPDGVGDDAEHPRHKAKIAYPLAVAKFDVTWEAWDRCKNLGGCSKVPMDAGFGHKGFPLINVTWDEANEYVAWLSRVTGKPYRLLSEAEWEYAARGVTSPDDPHSAWAYHWGDLAKDICQFANGLDTSAHNGGYSGDATVCDDGYVTTSPAGKFPANAFGLFDMHGNVWQWTEDAWHDNYADNPPADGAVWQNGNPSSRVLRGGSWDNSPQYLRSAVRYGYSSDYRSFSIGFRVGRTLAP